MKLFQEVIFKQCEDDELILIADFLNAAFDETADAVYDELFVKMKAMVSKYADTDVRHGEHGSTAKQSQSV